MCSGRDGSHSTPGPSWERPWSPSGWSLVGPCPLQVAVRITWAHIGFGVFLKTKTCERKRAGEMVEVLPIRRYKAHLVPEDGSLACLEAGICQYWQRTAPLGAGGLEAGASRCIQALPRGGPWLR